MGSSDSFEVNNIVSNSEEQAQQLLYELTQLVGQIAIEERALKQTSNSKIGSLDAKYLQKLDSRDALMSDLEKQFGQLPLEHGLEPIDPFLHAYK
ncbi:MAG: hypothetical protein EZS28_008593 [Streblomastix strix]|uniref:Uncharacterized protein n=1 Tax=Streblomastix strix TaxID=222440 RepID=A0A5J4WLP3_9EUKA|nr:MAG: hypothetical protein EZS28_008593 [Streblomastix strix]